MGLPACALAMLHENSGVSSHQMHSLMLKMCQISFWLRFHPGPNPRSSQSSPEPSWLVREYLSSISRLVNISIAMLSAPHPTPEILTSVEWTWAFDILGWNSRLDTKAPGPHSAYV